MILTPEPEKLDPEIEPTAPEDVLPPAEPLKIHGPGNLEEAEEFSTSELLSAGPSDEHEEPDRSPALTINIQSWATPVVGLLMLVIGLAGGFFGRPLISAPEPTPTAVPAAVQPPASNPQPPSSAGQGSQQQSQASQADRQALMEALVPQVRHFKGNPDAPITIIEFSDFQ